MVKFPVFRDLMASLWHHGKGISIKEIGEKRYMFTFYHVIDMERVLGSGPWLFEQNLLVLKELKPGDIPLRVPLNEAEFWVKVHNVPYDFMNLGVARRVGNFVGKFISFDESQFEERWNSYMRIRVCMDIWKALKRGMISTSC
ncbi:unnamed protein product [Cuscuta europaea]|uniref:DUF4283 domain-containing protein n=1 Tax=Cuscuta europaea TaxID=41803 RepID=A0A9P0YM06_CUSEU|nr:unnamed protein product [Cuscuta europaea]